MPEVINGEVSVPGDTLNGEINPGPQNASPQNSETEQGDPAENVVEGWPDLPLSNERASASRRSWRFGLVSVFVFIGWAILVTRLIQLQGAQRQLMNDRVARQSIFGEVIPARPGEILDRNGQVLALTIPCDSLFAVPEEISDPWDFAWRVGPILQLNADEVYHRIVDNADKRFVWIQRRISDAQVATIRELNLPKTTWGLRANINGNILKAVLPRMCSESATSITRDRAGLNRVSTT